MHPRGLTPVEARIDRAARRLLDRQGQRRSDAQRRLVELLVFGAKQAWACVFGGALIVLILLSRLIYPADAPIARDDALTIAAVLVQVLMLAFRLESWREFRVILLFHVVGTAMEVFKTDVGSWTYDGEGLLRIGGVPLFSGFMYAAIGSYLVRVHNLFDLRFSRYPRRWLTALVAAGIYVNFFAHHWFWDARWVLLALVVVLYARTVMHVRIHDTVLRMPILIAFGLVALFIWIAENVGTWAGAWRYPSQLEGWHLVGPEKFVSWYLLMLVSVVLVTWVYKPKSPSA